MPSVLLWTSCGTQRLLRPLSGPCILLATAPTTPPCFGRRPQSSPLHVQRKIYFYLHFICSSEKSADFSELHFHGDGSWREAASAAVGLRPSRSDFRLAEPQKAVKRSSRRTGGNLQLFGVEPTALGLSAFSHSNTLCTGNNAQKGEPPIGRLAFCVLRGNFISPE